MRCNGGQSWQAGTSQTITWAYTGNPGSSVKIELYKGSSLNRTITSSTPLINGSYLWTIPSDVAYGTDYLIKITSTSILTSDVSDSYFTINAAPAFSASGLVTSGDSGLSGVTVTFSRVSGTATIPASVITSVSGNWSQTGFQPGTTYKVTPSKSGYAFSPIYLNFSNESAGLNFTGTQESITITAPNGGQNWKAGSAQTITWTSAGNPGSYVKIELLKGGVLNRTISSRTSIGSGSFAWKIHPKQSPGSNYRIRITSTSDTTVNDTSDTDFTILKK